MTAFTRRPAATALVIAGMAGLAADVFQPRAPVPRNIVIITLDTTRADRLSPYGYHGVAMPALDRLAAEGIVFDRATTVAPLTLPAHTSLFTGKLPPRHGVRDNGDRPLATEEQTLAEVLRDRGFRTGAFVGSAVLNADRGLAQGFDVYRGVEPGPGRLQRPANEVLADAVEWVGGVAHERFMAWVHLYDPHRPYDPPDPYSSVHDPYVGEIAFADAQIVRLLDFLEGRGVLDRTIVVIAADHGESLGEHGERDHGIFVYESVLRVPLIIRAPGLRPERRNDVVRLVDVMPTLLTLVGVRPPPCDGVSLLGGADDRGRREELDAYAESFYPLRFGLSPVRALSDGRYKYIAAPRPELYDLSRDPFEQRNLVSERPGVAAAMQTRLAAYEGEPGDSSPSAVPEDVLARLRALGYVGAGSRPPADMTLRDPKDCVAAEHGTLEPEAPVKLLQVCAEARMAPGPGKADTPKEEN